MSGSFRLHALRTVAVVLVLMALSGCGNRSDFEERVDYWQSETAYFIRGRVTLDELHRWLRERGVFYTFEDSDIVDGNWRMTVETVYPKGIRCQFANIVLHVQLDESQVIQSFYYDFEGACWW